MSSDNKIKWALLEIGRNSVIPWIKERTIILANANKDSQIIRGEGDAKAAEIYANAYNQDPEFYAFYRSIDAYRNSIGNANDIMVIDPDNEFFQYLNKSKIDW